MRTKHVCRSTDLCSRSTGPVNQDQPRAGSCLGRLLGRPFLCNGQPDGQPGHVCARRAHRSTGAVDRALSADDRALSKPALSAILAPFDLLSRYLLSPYRCECRIPM